MEVEVEKKQVWIVTYITGEYEDKVKAFLSEKSAMAYRDAMKQKAKDYGVYNEAYLDRSILDKFYKEVGFYCSYTGCSFKVDCSIDLED